jgi:hypothetical protein
VIARKILEDVTHGVEPSTKSASGGAIIEFVRVTGVLQIIEIFVSELGVIESKKSGSLKP